jgi:uncharacterized protein YoxC
MADTHHPIERLTQWIGSISSLIVHTFAFIGAFLLGLFHVFSWENILLIVTTIVSLEAIYLAIFIQMTVNQNTETLKEVEVDVDEIQKDIDEIEQDVDEIQEDVDEIQEDVDEIQEVDAKEAENDAQHRETLASISARLHQLLQDIEAMKK